MTRAHPILVVEDDELIRDSLAVEHYLAKPLKLAALLELVQMHCRG